MALGLHGIRYNLGIPTPELGITETLSDYFGQGRTSQGGSNLFGDQSQTTLVPSGTTSTGQTKFAPTGTSGAYGIKSTSGQNVAISDNILGASDGTQQTTVGSDSRLEQLSKMGDRNPVQDEEYRKLLAEQQSTVDDADAQLRSTIKSGFDQLRQGMGNLIPNYESLRDQLIQDAQGGFNTFQGNVDEFRQNTRNLVTDRTNTAKQNLSQNVRDMMRANALQLGALSPNSSASRTMSPYAFQKIANREMGSIEGQATDLLTRAKQTYDEMIATAQSNMTAKISDVKERYGQAIIQIRDRIVQADAQEAQALANLEQQILDEARNKLATFEQNFYNEQQAIKQWTLNQVAELDDMRLQGANYDPGQIAFNRLDMAGIDTRGIGGDFYNPMAYAKKIEEDYQS